MLSMTQLSSLAVGFIQARFGEIARQVVQPIAPALVRCRGQKVHQAPPYQLAQSILCQHLFHLPDRCRSSQIEVGRKDGEHRP